MSYKTLGALALLAGICVPGAAMAASTAVATTNVNLRAGPSTEFPPVNVVAAGHGVRVHGCLSTRSWCDVSYGGQRGWMSSNYIAFVDGGQRYTGTRAISAIRAPVVTFSFGSYWDNHYRGRSFYRDRDRWERRDARQDVREERRERDRARRDVIEERRTGGDVRDARRDLREERRELRDARRHLRQERRD
ncbi:SH3 domain-containing protein [Chelativorans sp.]|uniref:SH3 domain-containing protein n=1 Tax=Chelativorans sp. TaxID=2203393 RepID=UPI002810DA10|nr:SH3 domain-containing protein [Chelativorans sp.]